jgi:hypothetical protein
MVKSMNGGNTHCYRRTNIKRGMAVLADLRSSCWLTRIRLKDTAGYIAGV